MKIKARHSVVSTAFLGAAISFGGLSEAAYGQQAAASGQSKAPAVTPKPPVQQIFYKDAKFEMEVLDYRARQLVQKILDKPDVPHNPAIAAMTRPYEEPYMVQYLAAFGAQMIVHKDAKVRENGVLWTRNLFTNNMKHQLTTELDAAITSVIRRLDRDSAVAVRKESLVTVAGLGGQLPRYQYQCFKAVMNAARDESPEVRQIVPNALPAVSGKAYLADTHAILTMLVDDEDEAVQKAAKAGLEQFEKVFPQFKKSESVVQPPVPNPGQGQGQGPASGTQTTPPPSTPKPNKTPFAHPALQPRLGL